MFDTLLSHGMSRDLPFKVKSESRIRHVDISTTEFMSLYVSFDNM